MTVLFTVLKFTVLFLLTTFVARTLIGGLIGSLVGGLLYLFDRKLVKQEFDSRQQTIYTQLCGLPAGAILISLGAIKALDFMRFGRLGSLTFFVLLVVFAIRDYADDAISNVARSFPGFLGEMLVYGVFLLKIART